MCVLTRYRGAGKDVRCKLGCGGAGAVEESKATELDVDAITLAELQQFNSNLLEADNEVLPSSYE